MSVVRKFLIAPSLVRLIRKERGGARVTEGYFTPKAGRIFYVRIEGQDCAPASVAVCCSPRADAGGRWLQVPFIGGKNRLWRGKLVT